MSENPLTVHIHFPVNTTHHLGHVVRKMCFSQATDCQCKLSTEIRIINCGDAYLYKRIKTRDFPSCFARACTVPDERGLSSLE